MSEHSAKSDIDSAKKEIDSAKREIDSAKSDIDSEKKEIDSAESNIDSSTQIVQDGEKIASTTTDVPAGAPVNTPIQCKGKGISIDQTAQDVSMDEADSSSEDEAAEGGADIIYQDEEDTMEEIDPTNIISDGRRTRGRNIDFAKAAREMGPDEEDEDEEDDDFQIAEDEEMKD